MINFLILISPFGIPYLILKLVTGNKLKSWEIGVVIISSLLASTLITDDIRELKNFKIGRGSGKSSGKVIFDFTPEYEDLPEEDNRYEDDKYDMIMDPRSSNLVLDYVTIINNATNSITDFNFKSWVLYGVHATEVGDLYQKDPIVPATSIKVDDYGKDRGDGLLLNLMTYGKEDIEKHGDFIATSQNHEYKIYGPFQFQEDTFAGIAVDGNKDGKTDIFNFADSAFTAAKLISNHAKTVEEVSDVDLKIAFALLIYNSGSGGANAKIGKADRKYFLEETVKKIYGDTSRRARFEAVYKKNGWNRETRKIILEAYDELGWKFSTGLQQEVGSYYTPKNKGDKDITSCPNDTSGSYVGFNKGWSGTKKVKKGIYMTNPETGHEMVLDLEGLEYIIKTNYIGNLLKMQHEDTIQNYGKLKSRSNKGGKSSDPSNKSIYDKYPTENSTSSRTREGYPHYYWQYQVNKDNIKTDRDRAKYIGAFGEVGMLGTFPIFNQEVTHESNQVKCQFKSNGKIRTDTTMQQACSLYAATTLIHAVGLGDVNIPNTNLKPSFKNMLTLFLTQNRPGPVTADQLEAQGYTTDQYSVVSSDKNSMDKFFSLVSSGTPYVLNIKEARHVPAIDVRTKQPIDGGIYLARSGHMIVVANGTIINGKKYIRVINSVGFWMGDEPQKDCHMAYIDYESNEFKQALAQKGYSYTIHGIKNFATTGNVNQDANDNTGLDKKQIPYSVGTKNIARNTLDFGIKDFKEKFLKSRLKPDNTVESARVINVPYNSLVIAEKDSVKFLNSKNKVFMVTNMKDISERLPIGKVQFVIEGSYIGKTTTSSKVLRMYYEDGKWKEHSKQKDTYE